MIALAFALLLLLAIWLAVQRGGVRKRSAGTDTPVRSRRRKAADRADGGVWIGSERDQPAGGDLPDGHDIKAGGGSFGGGGASGDWSDGGDTASSGGDGGGGD